MQRPFTRIAVAMLLAGFASGCATQGGALGTRELKRSELHAPSAFDGHDDAENADVFELQSQSNADNMG
jgi:hypothetical protein